MTILQIQNAHVTIPEREDSMMRKLITLVFLAPLCACSTIPSGPSALVLPGQQKNEAQFRGDDVACRQFAHTRLLATPHPPQSLGEGQLHFDIDYLQCMYGKGHMIPVSGEVVANPLPGTTNPIPPVDSQGFSHAPP